MTFEQLTVCFADRLRQLEDLAEKTNKKTVLVIQQFPTDLDDEILVPNIRETISNIVAFVEIGNLKTLEYIIQKSDGVFDAIITDTDMKCSFSESLIEYINRNIKKSPLFYFSDNTVWADAALNYIQNIEKGLYKKNILLCGKGFLYSKLLIRLLDSGSKVYTDAVTERIQINNDNILSVGQKNMFKLADEDDLKNVDLVIGASVKQRSLQDEIVEKIRTGTNFYDIGIGNFSDKVIDAVSSRNGRVFRLDNRAGISGLLISLFETNYLINEMMGKVFIKDIEIVAGGIMGRNGAVIVDNIKNPSFIIGIADGFGKVKPKPGNDKEDKNLNFVKQLINKS